MAPVTQHVVNAYQEDYGNVVLAAKITLKVATRQSALVIKVSGQMCSNAFKRRLPFSFTIIILA